MDLALAHIPTLLFISKTLSLCKQPILYGPLMYIMNVHNNELNEKLLSNLVVWHSVFGLYKYFCF